MMLSIALFGLLPWGLAQDAVRYLDYKREPVQGLYASRFEEHLAYRGKDWTVTLYSLPEKKVICRYHTQDSGKREIEGLYLQYFDNGFLSDSGYFTRNRKHGPYYQWHQTGAAKLFFTYHHGLPADTGWVWHPTGELSEWWVCDENGNGTLTLYHASGRVRASGKLKNGQPEGRYTYTYANGAVAMEVSYRSGDVLDFKCYDELGNRMRSNCDYQSEPEFPGGPEAWAEFVRTHLVHPKELRTIKNKVEGLVQIAFDVNTNGTLSNFDVVYSAHPDLAAAAIQLLAGSPPWKPAQYLNQPIQRRLVQAIQFLVQF